MGQAAQTTDSIWQWAAKHIAGTFSSSEAAAEKLRLAAQHCRLIGGAAITPLIEGHEVMITVIPIDINDTYPIRQSKKEQEEGAPKRVGIGKATLMTIANAAGVEWLTTERLDDGADPHLFVYHVSGRFRSIDGQYKPVVGDKDNDLRDGSDQIAMKSEMEVKSLRATAMRSAITKAKLRALREAFGVPHGVRLDDVDRPFVFAKVIFTGRSEDPAARRMFAQVIAMQQLAATAAMYGGQLPDMQLPAMEEPRGALPQRTMVVTTNGEVVCSPPPPTGRVAAPPQQRARAAQPAKRDSSPSDGGAPVAKFGRGKGKPLKELSDEEIDWYANALAQMVEDPAKERWRVENETLLQQAQAEQDARNGSNDTPRPPVPDDDRGDDPERY